MAAGFVKDIMSMSSRRRYIAKLGPMVKLLSIVMARNPTDWSIEDFDSGYFIFQIVVMVSINGMG
jgi:hypothetical protein